MANSRPTISTHVLDLESGAPAAGFPVALFRLGTDGQPSLVAEAVTDGDGRIASLLDEPLEEGDYQLVFDLAAYADGDDLDTAFFDNAAVGFHVDDASRSYHLPLLMTAFGLSVYRGS